MPHRGDGPDEPWNREARLNELANSKRSVALNLTTAAGREVFLDLVEHSDVVLENYSPRVMGNFGLEWDTLSARNPQIIYVAMPAFGNSGPWRDRISYGPGIDAMSGLSWLTGYADGSPLKPGNFYCDQNAGLHAALSTVAAILARGRVGGQTVELAMLEGELQLIGEAMVGQQLSGREPTRIGNEHTSAAPHGVYPAKPVLDDSDSWIAIACRDDAEWRRCSAFGRIKRCLATDGSRPDFGVGDIETSSTGCFVSGRCCSIRWNWPVDCRTPAFLHRR